MSFMLKESSTKHAAAGTLIKTVLSLMYTVFRFFVKDYPSRILLCDGE